MSKKDMVEVIRAKFAVAKEAEEMSLDSLFPMKREAGEAAKAYFADVAALVEEVMA